MATGDGASGGGAGEGGRSGNGASPRFFAPDTRGAMIDFSTLTELETGAGAEPRLGLLVVGCRVLEPTVECVPVVARQRVTDHAGPRTACRWAGSAIGPMISNRRPCWSDGIFARAAVTSAGSITARITPGSVSPSARMRPQGSTIRE